VMGNSEIGHTTIGTGRVNDTDLVRISKVARGNAMGAVPEIRKLFDHVLKHNSVLHLFGMIGPGSVHAHCEHLYGMLRAAKTAGITKVAVHAFTDGRDTPPNASAGYLKELEEVMQEVGLGFIASVSGRYYAMDRDNNWDRIERVEKAAFGGHDGRTVKGMSASDLVRADYEKAVMDEHVEPVVFLDEDGKSFTLQENDGAFFVNYRLDRSRQLASRIQAHAHGKNIYFVTMTNYDEKKGYNVAFDPEQIETNLAEQFSRADLTQAHIAETEKYAHVTFYFNAGREQPYQGEEHVLISSRKDIRTHDEAPEMRAVEIADAAIERIGAGKNFVLLNFANADMVGHTANREAMIRGIETVDAQLKRVVEAAEKQQAVVFITADHGNAEIYYDTAIGAPHTAHTTNQVPFIAVGLDAALSSSGTLADIAPTILAMFGLHKPASMTGKSLLKASS
jgi:2,3-bisphosphoglycerate-independent phosphoglycerate mutase